jgi:hypothetical protein
MRSNENPRAPKGAPLPGARGDGRGSARRRAGKALPLMASGAVRLVALRARAAQPHGPGHGNARAGASHAVERAVGRASRAAHRG